MTDADLLLLYDEEMRRYNAYVTAMNGSTRLHSQRIDEDAVAEARAHWIELHEKLRPRLPALKRRALLQARVAKKDVRRAR